VGRRARRHDRERRPPRVRDLVGQIQPLHPMRRNNIPIVRSRHDAFLLDP
jgi:hypothetical protein